MGVLAGWAYRKAITVNHTDDGAQTNYQMKLTVNHGDGADSTGLVYLNHHALNWPTDIQITASDGTTAVDFWREESDATDGTWWIECPSIAAGSTWTGYIYYGGLDAADASNGTNTFTFFDHFTAAWPDGLWSGNTEHATVASSILSLTGHGNATWMWLLASAGQGAATFRQRMNTWLSTAASAGYACDSVGCRVSNDWNNTNNWVATYFSDAAENLAAANDGAGTGINTNTDFTGNSFVTVEILVRGGTNQRWFENEVERASSPFTAKKPNVTTMKPSLAAYDDNALSIRVKCDWVFTANYTLNEPTWAASGAEEALGRRSVPRIAKIMLMSP